MQKIYHKDTYVTWPHDTKDKLEIKKKVDLQKKK
jgi:hypothetical protein